MYYGAVLDAKKEITARMTFGLSADMDIVAEPGTMRISLRFSPRACLIHFAVAVVALILACLTAAWGVLAVTSWGSLAESETIEINNQKLVIRRKNLGWTRTSEYDTSTNVQTSAQMKGKLGGSLLRCGARRGNKGSHSARTCLMIRLPR